MTRGVRFPNSDLSFAEEICPKGMYVGLSAAGHMLVVQIYLLVCSSRINGAQHGVLIGED